MALKHFDTAKQLQELRQNIEDNFAEQPAHAYSIDGKTFSFETSLRKPFQTGDFVLVTSDDDRKYLGQILRQAVVEKDGPEYGVSMDAGASAWIVNATTSSNFRDRVKISLLTGFGDILGRLDGDSFQCTSNTDVFQNAKVTHAPSEVTKVFLEYQNRNTNGLEIGKAVHSQSIARVYLRADGFNRHTFLCGQSGSGKTFSLGVILEQLFLHTNLRIIILDPNSDFVRFDSIRRLTDVNGSRSLKLSPDRYDQLAEKYQSLQPHIRILRSNDAFLRLGKLNATCYPLRLDFSSLHWADQAALLRLDPLADRDEYQSFQTIIKAFNNQRFSLHDLRERVRRDFSESARHLGLRIENLGISEWSIWKPSDTKALEDHLAEDWRLCVVDIGSLAMAEEQLATALTVLGFFWRSREQRRPILLVVDEAHNLCPQQPMTPPEQVTVDHFVRIAGEGRKFGIYLLMASQRPGKIHQNVLTQCENIVLMKMNSRADLTRVAEIFSQIPTAFLDEAPKFGLGQALVTGRVVRTPTLVQFEGRLSEEGGADVATTWASPTK
jgi:uncharacterized protein